MAMGDEDAIPPDLGLELAADETCSPGLAAQVWNYSVNSYHDNGSAGNFGYGSFQALLHGFSCNQEQMGTGSTYLHQSALVVDDPEGTSVEEVERAMTPTRDNVDESGYLSSDSSVYAVNSEDEVDDEKYFYNYNYDDYNCIEDEMNNKEKSSDPLSLGEINQCPCLSSDPFMHVMTEVTEENGGGWKRRKRNQEKRPDCRVPKGMGAIEVALRNAPYRKTKYIFEPLVGLTFDSEEAYQFYNMYSWEVGFGIKKKDETTSSFEWVFTEFVSLMGGKVPKTVFTDQCAAMAAALSNIWLGAKHMLCKWHVLKDAPAKLGVIYRKGSRFRKLFHKIII